MNLLLLGEGLMLFFILNRIEIVVEMFVIVNINL